MKALFLIAAFVVAASGLTCPGGTCHDDHPQAGWDADHATPAAQHCCQCLACGTLAAVNAPCADVHAFAPEPSGWIGVPRTPVPRGVDSDTPFHPPRA